MCQNKLLGVVGGVLGHYTSLIFQKLFSGKSAFLINQFTFWKFSQLCFSFWYANINIPNDAAWGGWWGFGTEHIADFSDFFWNPIISCMIYQKFISDFSEQNFWNTINCIFAISLNVFSVWNIILVSLKCAFEPDGKRWHGTSHPTLGSGCCPLSRSWTPEEKVFICKGKK